MEKLFISVVMTTYNWPAALKAALRGLAAQTVQNFEVIVADDGSKDDTRILVENLAQQFPISLTHVWQEDLGFRASRARNLAILKARGNYLVFIDGDCIARPDFIARHQALASSQRFVAGNRLLLNQDLSRQALEQQLPLHTWSFGEWFRQYRQGNCNRLLPLLRLPLGPLRYALPKRWQGAKGCNLGVWKTDLAAINGWEEKFQGWGYEDSDLVQRLIQLGIQGTLGHCALGVIHLWHSENDRSRERGNWQMWQNHAQQKRIQAEIGLKEHNSDNSV